MAGWCHDAGYAFAPPQLDHAEAGGVILADAGASFADAVRSHGDPDVLAMSDLLLIVNTADMMCGPDGVPVSFVERLADVEARYGVGSRQAVDVGAMLGVLRRELEMRGVSVAAAERAGVERVDAVGESVGGATGADDAADADVSDTEDAVDSLWALLAAFHAPTPPVRVLRPRGRQRAVQGVSRGCWRAERVVGALKRFHVGAYAV